MTSHTDQPRRITTAGVLVVAFVLSFAFLGTRGIWDPDEGRYTNVALNMLESGDWLNPKRNHETGHWTKPPVTYWMIASSVGAFGRNPWAARLPFALAFLVCAWGAMRVARRLAPGTETMAALVFATMLVPFGAVAFISTDFPLAAFQTIAMTAYVEERFGDHRHPARWLTVMWAAFALAFLTKGPPALLPLLGIFAFEFLVPAQRSGPFVRWFQIVVFVLLAGPWYVAVILGHPGLLEYFLGAEVVGRVTSSEFKRNGQWYGWLLIYGPTLLVGTLPWTATFLRRLRSLPSRLSLWRRDAAERERAAPELFLVLWFFIPLIAFCIARSRLPLYLLALFVPLAVVIALQQQREGRPAPRVAWVAVWVLVLVSLRVASSWWPTHKDARAWADAIRERASGPVSEVVFVDDMARYGLHLHLDAEIEKVSLDPVPDAQFNPTFDDDLAGELAERERQVVYVTKESSFPAVRNRAVKLGFQPRVLGEPYNGRVLFSVAPAAGARREQR